MPQWFVKAAGALGQATRLLGWVVFASSVLAPQLGTRLYKAQSEWELGATMLLSVVVAWVAAVVLHGAGANLYVWSLRRRAANAHAVLARDPRPPVLYLRPFQEDLEQARRARQVAFVPTPTLGYTAEAMIHDTLASLGPLVAIGRPGEPLPPRGFARLYLADEDWQGAVVELLHRAAVVVLVAGTSAGVIWEIDHALRRTQRRRIVIVVPAWPTFDYEVFRGVLQRRLGCPVPSLGPAHWKAWPLEIRALLSLHDDSVALHEFPPPRPLPKEIDPWKRAQLEWYQRRGIPSYPPPEVQAQGLLLDALTPRLQELGVNASDPGLPYWRPDPPSMAQRTGRRLGMVLLVTLAIAWVAGVVFLLTR